MEYLSRGFKSVLGNQQGGSQPSPHETVRICLNFVIYDVWQFQTFILTINFIQVERLCDRVASSTLLEDRRDAVRALKSLSKVNF